MRLSRRPISRVRARSIVPFRRMHGNTGIGPHVTFDTWTMCYHCNAGTQARSPSCPFGWCASFGSIDPIDAVVAAVASLRAWDPMHSNAPTRTFDAARGIHRIGGLRKLGTGISLPSARETKHSLLSRIGPCVVTCVLTVSRMDQVEGAASVACHRP